MRIHKLLFSFFITLSLLISFNVQAQSDPVAMLQRIANQMISGLKANKATLKTKPGIVYSLAYRYVVPNAAITAMAQGVLPPRIWNSATPAQRAQFQREFTKTLIRTYASALTSYEDQTIRFYPVRGGSANSVVVSSDIISSEAEPIRVTYRLIRAGGGWKLYDLSVEGVSMLESFRSQFADILSNGNMQQLLDRMSAHNRR